MITKLQQGGQMEQQLVQLVQAAMSGDQQATQQIDKIMQAAQQGDQQAMQIAKYVQTIAKQLQGSRKAKLGAKLAYYKYLKQGGRLLKYQKGGWINKSKGIWNWDSMDRFNRVKSYYQGKTDDISDDDWNYLMSNPELESALHNIYKFSKIPNKRDTVAISAQSGVNNMPKGANPNVYIASVPDSTNNYKGRLGVGQFQMLPKTNQSSQQSKKGLTRQQANNRKQNFHNWQKVAQNRGYGTGTFMPYMHSQGFVYNYDHGTWFNPKTNLYLYATPEGRVVQQQGQYRVPYNGIRYNLK